jgi:hypothetical protein
MNNADDGQGRKVRDSGLWDGSTQAAGARGRWWEECISRTAHLAGQGDGRQAERSGPLTRQAERGQQN